MPATTYRFGSETHVNDKEIIGSTNNNANVGLAPLPNGGWVTAWASFENKIVSIHQQVFDKNGTATLGVDGEIVGSSTVFVSQPSIGMLKNGGWVIGWSNLDTPASFSDTHFQRYDENAHVVGNVDTSIGSKQDFHQNEPTIVGLEDGGWIASWYGPNSVGYQQRFLKNGNPATPAPVLVSSQVNVESSQPRISALPDQGWVVTFTGRDQNGTSDIYQHRFDKNGNAIQADIGVNAETTNRQSGSDITVLTDGGWVITWQSQDQDAFGGFGIYQQRYDKNGHALYTNATGGAVDQLVNTTSAGDQKSAKVTALSGGGWVVTWIGEKASGLDYGIYQRAYDKTGRSTSDEHLVSINTKPKDIIVGSDTVHEVTALADGSWVVAWAGYKFDDETFGHRELYQQRFMLNEAPKSVDLKVDVVAENTATGTAIGTVSGEDSNLAQGDALTFSLSDNAGGRFALDGLNLKVADSKLLNYEAATSHTIKVRATDKDGEFVEKTFAIQIGDVLETPNNPNNPNNPDPVIPTDPNTPTDPTRPLHWTGTSGNDLRVGTKFNDILRGLGGNDTLSGEDGTDTIYGGAGKDKLSGGAGADIFVFDTKMAKTAQANKANLDTITDFTVGQDKIYFDDLAFSTKDLKKLAKGKSEANPAKLSSKFFKSFDKKHPLKQEKDDYFLHNKDKGTLFYDADANGSGGMTQIATLSNKAKLSAKDLWMC